ncbi:MAG: hypothetical protein HYX94_10230 [Chloroflexi bacterium]|nr:hypothetical protein [Chloroflexota bacterium]
MASEAERIGLVNEIVPAAKLVAAAEALAAKLVDKRMIRWYPPFCLPLG